MSSTRRYDLLRSRLDRFTRTLHGVESGEIGAVHRVRVASRRLRELLPVLEIEQAGALYLPERLHRVRLALKKLRYGVELAVETAGIKDNSDLVTLRRGQEL